MTLVAPNSSEETTASGYRGRFAPSPSGPLHFGSLVAALASYLDARANRGLWFLRFEDVDSERCDPRYKGVIREQLRAHGLLWDAELPAQADRLNRYREQVELWLNQGRAYACRCTRKQLAPFRQQGETRYPGWCRPRGLDATESAIRFALKPIACHSFSDRACGPQQQNVASQCGDFVIRRRNGDFAYQLAVVVDDADQAITHVVRGVDLLASTGRQLCLFEALGRPPPQYLHHRLVHGADGRKLSKATGAAGLSEQSPLKALGEALNCLAQAPIEGADGVEDLLRRAVAQWQPHAAAPGSLLTQSR